MGMLARHREGIVRVMRTLSPRDVIFVIRSEMTDTWTRVHATTCKSRFKACLRHNWLICILRYSYDPTFCDNLVGSMRVTSTVPERTHFTPSLTRCTTRWKLSLPEYHRSYNIWKLCYITYTTKYGTVPQKLLHMETFCYMAYRSYNIWKYCVIWHKRQSSPEAVTYANVVF